MAWTELPWRHRASWLLKEKEDMSYDEIAVVLETSPPSYGGTVATGAA